MQGAAREGAGDDLPLGEVITLWFLAKQLAAGYRRALCRGFSLPSCCRVASPSGRSISFFSPIGFTLSRGIVCVGVCRGAMCVRHQVAYPSLEFVGSSVHVCRLWAPFVSICALICSTM